MFRVGDFRRLTGGAVSTLPLPIAFGLRHNLVIFGYFAGRLFRRGVLLVFFLLV